MVQDGRKDLFDDHIHSGGRRESGFGGRSGGTVVSVREGTDHETTCVTEVLQVFDFGGEIEVYCTG